MLLASWTTDVFSHELNFTNQGVFEGNNTSSRMTFDMIIVDLLAGTCHRKYDNESLPNAVRYCMYSTVHEFLTQPDVHISVNGRASNLSGSWRTIHVEVVWWKDYDYCAVGLKKSLIKSSIPLSCSEWHVHKIVLPGRRPITQDWASAPWDVAMARLLSHLTCYRQQFRLNPQIRCRTSSTNSSSGFHPLLDAFVLPAPNSKSDRSAKNDVRGGARA